MNFKRVFMGAALATSLVVSLSATAEDETSNIDCSNTNLPGKDYVNSHPEFNKILFENDRIRTFEYTLEPGEKEGCHSHPDVLIYIAKGGTILSEFEQGDPAEFIEIEGEAKYIPAGGNHTSENISDEAIVLIITEFK
ncbi:MAG: hypothetical protein COC19_00795 [SAR86 cluster bacterium]|uniref:Cupin domain-containing protein n=1 Tax=SAR86 cluster bacterium TaxID=2030880 RepID=A0A2A4MV59_9GAMM|nr:MAG: hypothetical protein COC19_00795 [SAR86 cluster bacterium]